MRFLRKLFKLPSPVELGWSKHNALESTEFSDDPQGKTWEEWHIHVQKLHPVKYFFAETLVDWFNHKIWWPIKHPVTDAHYWFVSHFIPNRRYHMLDLRQPKMKGELADIDCYRYGWQDVPEKMLYAMFNLLGEYLNGEQPVDLKQWYTDQQIEADPGMRNQQGSLNEARTIYHWWAVGRKKEILAHSEMLTTWADAKKKKDPAKEKYWTQLKKMEEDMETKTDEMIARLMKIRRSLWT